MKKVILDKHTPWCIIISMNRTQIYLPKSQQVALKKEAQKRGTTVSAVVRDAIEEKLITNKAPKKQAKYESLLQAAERINKLGEAGPPDLATNMDEYLYGGKK